MTKSILKKQCFEINAASVNETAKNMRTHFAQTGTYRVEDLDYILGDLRKSVGLEIPSGYSFSAHLNK
jgi:hypothetical protein